MKLDMNDALFLIGCILAGFGLWRISPWATLALPGYLCIHAALSRSVR